MPRHTPLTSPTHSADGRDSATTPRQASAPATPRMRKLDCSEASSADRAPASTTRQPGRQDR